MTNPTGPRPRTYIVYVATVVMTVVSSFLCGACKNGGKQYGEAVTSRDSTSVMTTRGVDMYISEDGVVRYHVIAEEWKIFDRLNMYSMEKGVLLETLDSAMQIESSIVADTAYYYSQDEIWELRKNVHAENTKKEKFDTHSLFINNHLNKMYSDSLIHIEQEKQIITGIGFESNSRLTDYTIRHTEGIFPIKDQ